MEELFIEKSPLAAEKAVSLREDYTREELGDLYFRCYYIQALNMIRNGHERINARAVLYSMQNDLLDVSDESIGWTYYYYALGRLYYVHTDYMLAKEAFDKCLASKGVKQDSLIVVNALINKGRAEYGMNECEACLISLARADKYNSEGHDVGLLNVTRALACAFLSEWDAFSEAYDDFKENSVGASKPDSLFVEAYKEYCDKGSVNLTKYECQLNDLKSVKLRYLIARAAGRNSDALANLETFYIDLKSMNSRENNSDYDLLNMSLVNERLVRANNQLQLENEQQHLKYRGVIIIALILGIFFILFGAISIVHLTRRKNRQVLEANQAKIDFVQTIAHDVRTPLNAVVGFSQLLALPPDFLTEEERESYSSFISANAQLLTILIDDVLTAGNTNHKMSVNVVDMDVNQIGKQAVLTCSHRCKPGVEMSFTSSVDDAMMVQSDPNRCLQVLINFLSNATKNTESGTIVLHCSADENPGKITYSVTDTGCGIPPEHQDIIFERFVKLDSKKQGSGLGLAICRQIAEALNAEVKLDRDYTGGSRFLFILPLND